MELNENKSFHFLLFYSLLLPARTPDFVFLSCQAICPDIRIKAGEL